MGTPHPERLAPPAPLPLEAGLVFVNALVTAIAEDHGIRYVTLKGDGAALQGLRSPRRSTDIDVWVDPARMDEFLALLSAHGWHRRPESLSWTLFITHSITLVHDRWPCDIDVHRTFPGMLGDPRELFDEMWSARVRAELHPNVSTWIPDRHSHAVVAALHALRSGRSAHARAQLADIMTRIDAWSREDREEIRDAAIRLHAETPMAALLRRWDVPVEPTRSAKFEAALWDIRRTASDHTFDWLYAVATAPRQRRVALLRRGLMPTLHDMTANHPATRESATARARILGARTLRGLISLPHALLGLLRLSLLRVVAGRSHGPTGPPAQQRTSAHLAGGPDHTASLGSDDANTRTAPQPDPSPRVPDEPLPASRPQRAGAAPLLFSNGDGTFVYNPHAPSVPPLRLSPTADMLWTLLVERRLSTDEVVDTVLARFNADPHEVRLAVHEFLNDTQPYRTSE